MTDTPPLGPLDLHLKWKLSIESPSLAYINKCMSKTVLFAVDILYPIFCRDYMPPYHSHHEARTEDKASSHNEWLKKFRPGLTLNTEHNDQQSSLQYPLY